VTDEESCLLRDKFTFASWIRSSEECYLLQMHTWL